MFRQLPTFGGAPKAQYLLMPDDVDPAFALVTERLAAV